MFTPRDKPQRKTYCPAFTLSSCAPSQQLALSNVVNTTQADVTSQNHKAAFFVSTSCIREYLVNGADMSIKMAAY